MAARIHWRLAGIALLVGMTSAQAPAETGRRVVRIKAERFAFTPSEITVAVGEQIEIRLKSDDTAHGFRLVGRGDVEGVDITIPKRGQGEAVVPFTARRAGRFEFECSHLCGAGHSFMRGLIVVKEKGQ